MYVCVCARAHVRAFAHFNRLTTSDGKCFCTQVISLPIGANGRP